MRKAMAIIGLLNIPLIFAIQSKHIVKIEIYTKEGHVSLGTYFRRLEQLEILAISSGNVKSVDTFQRKHTIYMTVVQNKLDKKQAKIFANNLAGRIREIAFIDQVKINSIRKMSSYTSTSSARTE